MASRTATKIKKAETNDEKIMRLRAAITEKKAQLKASERFNPITTCSLELFGTRYNLHAVNDKGQLALLLVQLNALKISEYDLQGQQRLSEAVKISGFPIDQWMQDIEAKLAITNRTQEQSRLRQLEATLHDLLSTDKKVELAVLEIENLI